MKAEAFYSNFASSSSDDLPRAMLLPGTGAGAVEAGNYNLETTIWELYRG